MLRRLAPLLTFLGVLLVGLFGLTLWVLESSGVAIVETQREDGGVRRTHVWFAEHGDEFWLEAGQPTNGWYVDALRDPEITLFIEGVPVKGRVEPIHETGAREWVRTLMRRKYGVRDQWVGFLIDESQSTPVRFHMSPQTQ